MMLYEHQMAKVSIYEWITVIISSTFILSHVECSRIEALFKRIIALDGFGEDSSIFLSLGSTLPKPF